MAALLVGLGGCSEHVDVIRPEVDLYHDLQGGVIAQQRPPPPGANDPYPNLGTIPARPAAADIGAQQRIADQLAAQRDAATVAAAAAPITPLAPPPAVPKPPAAPDPNANRVVVDAAPAPTPPPTPGPAPAKPAPAAAASAAPALAGIDSVPAVPATVASGPLPNVAAAPPAFPTGLPAIFTPSPPVAPAAAAPPPPTAPATGVLVMFTPGSSTLPPSASLNLRRYALAHKGATVTVTGHGDATATTPDAQSRALDLALRRAQAIAASLVQAGVPLTKLNLTAEATGRGGTAL
jgi:outer membrane protein OmpA-like peptidoglycan-associated protein